MACSRSSTYITAFLKIGFGQLGGMNGLEVLNPSTSKNFKRRWFVGRILQRIQDE
jgi:hypothetical protein